MWISRAEYNALKSLNKKHRSQYMDSLCWQIEQLRKEKSKLREQCEEYKQKYADEVNKRLELIKFYEEKHA